MTRQSTARRRPEYVGVTLGIEGGGTRSTVLMLDDQDRKLADFPAAAAVLPLMSDRELLWHLRDIAARLPVVPQRIGIGLAGVRTAVDAERLQRAAARIWPGIPCVATNDLETALHAAPPPHRPVTRVLVLSGTGSCCYGVHPDGRTAKVGGRGHVIGDRGSACDIGLRALRAVMADLDHSGSLGTLGAALLNALMFTDVEQLIPWSVNAPKTEIAALATTVFAVAQAGDRAARLLLREAAEMLAADACACAQQLVPQGNPVVFLFNGGVLLKNPGFARQVTQRIRACWENARVQGLKHPSVMGAVRLARALSAAGPAIATSLTPAEEPLPTVIADLANLAGSPTEARNPRSLKLDSMSLEKGIDLMLQEEARLPDAIRAQKRAIAQVINRVVRAFRAGGRLFYIGAGTSGRLGVLDASEIPPTFRAPREQVQGIIAGGRQALWSAVEGAEDDVHAGRAAVRSREMGTRDVLVGIAASGRTPFVWGALHEARRRGAFTVLLCFNPRIREAAAKLRGTNWRPHVIIAPDCGPEVLTGSTRLKAGTATKLVLNMITTLAMVRAGKVLSNLMVDLNPSNTKLRDRAVRILRDLTGCTADEASATLRETGWAVHRAFQKLRRSSARRKWK